jgi:acetyl esterase/lipase
MRGCLGAAILAGFVIHCGAHRDPSAPNASPVRRSRPAQDAMQVVRNVKYVGADYPNDKDKVDLYLPKAAGFPTVVVVHGGALLEGDKADPAQRAFGERMAGAGIGAVVVNYRLSPAVSHPVHVRDAARSFAWAKRNIASYGGDPREVFVVGYSAGAYLAMLLATDERYLGEAGVSASDIRGVASVSGFFWVERVAPDRDKSVWGSDARAWSEASPARYVGAHVPTTLLVYADGDEAWRRDQNAEMEGLLRAVDPSRVELALVRGRDHETIWSGVARGDDEVVSRIAAFVRSRK